MDSKKSTSTNTEVQRLHHVGLEVPDPQRIRKALRLIRDDSKGHLLDIGYSKGSFADYLVEAGWDCTGLDISPHEHPRIKTIQCDILDGLPVESESYDVVTAGEIIEHTLQEGDFLDECYRVLKPDGELLLTTPNLAFFLNRFLVLAGRVPMFVYAPYHYHFHTKKTLTELVSQHGFEVDRVIASHVLYSTRRHPSGKIFEWLADVFPTFGAHLILLARKVK